MPYPIGFHIRKQPGAGASGGGSSQSRWNNVPDFSFDSGNETTSDDIGSDSVGADRSINTQAPLPPPEFIAGPKITRTPAERERELSYALVSAHRNLTHISQYILKLEARANIATKEDVRQTLEATLDNIEYSSREDAEPGHEKLIEDVRDLSDRVWNRVYLVDKSFRRVSRKNRTEDGLSGPIKLLGESHTKAWLESVIASNALVGEETLFYTVGDMAAGRPFSLWLAYIRDLCQLGGDDGPPLGEGRVVSIAWAFLDRSIRPPRRPRATTSVAQFVAEWDSLRKSGAFAAALEDPESQRESDAEILQSLRGLWSARTRPL